jgi:TPR repeat protein
VSYISLYLSCLCGPVDAWLKLKEMADGGDMVAKIYVMVLHNERTSSVVPGDYVASQGLLIIVLPWLRREASEGNNLHALYEFGQCYEHGKGVDENIQEELKWFTLAANQGHAVARYKRGHYYEYTDDDEEIDMSKALTLYKLAAMQGHVTAQFAVGDCYEHGRGVSADMHEGVKWFRLAAEQGHAVSQCTLGYCYENGEGVEVDKEKAFKWYKLYADEGDELAQFSMGYCFEHGDGVAVDIFEAFQWY